MQQFIEFSFRHWELWLAFFVTLALLLSFELHIKLTAAPGVTAQQAIFLLNREGALLLDIRNANAFAKEHIMNSINIPFSELADKIKQTDISREKTIIINFGQGQPHHKTAKILKHAGFTNLYHLKGGISSWKHAELPLTKK